MTGLLDDVVVVLELLPERELDPEDELNEEEPLLDDEVSLPLLEPELLPDELLADDADEELLPELFLLAPALDLLGAAPWVALPPPEEPLELTLP